MVGTISFHAGQQSVDASGITCDVERRYYLPSAPSGIVSQSALFLKPVLVFSRQRLGTQLQFVSSYIVDLGQLTAHATWAVRHLT